MSFPRYIDLKTGADCDLGRLHGTIWILALANWLVALTNLPWWLGLTCLWLLVHLRPRFFGSGTDFGDLRLFADGGATCHGKNGRWPAQAWQTRKWCVISFIPDDPAESRAQRLIVSRQNNHPDDYRRLCVWLRFDPRDEKGMASTAADP